MKLEKEQAELLNISDGQAYRILKKMSDNNKLVLVGNGRIAKYKLKK